MFLSDRFPVPCAEPNHLTSMHGLLAGKYRSVTCRFQLWVKSFYISLEVLFLRKAREKHLVRKFVTHLIVTEGRSEFTFYENKCSNLNFSVILANGVTVSSIFISLPCCKMLKIAVIIICTFT